MIHEIRRKEAYGLRLRAENLKFRRLLTEEQYNLRRARNDAENARRFARQCQEMTDAKLTMATAITRFFITKLPDFVDGTSASNICLLCPDFSNIQTTCNPPHKFCNSCFLKMGNFTDVHSTGKCPVCRVQIQEIMDVEYTAEDDPDHIEKQNQVSVNN